MLAPNISTNNDTSCKVNICIQNKASAVQTTLAFHMTAHFLSLSLAPSDRVVTSVHAVLASSDPALCFFLRLFSFFFIFASHAFFRASSIFFDGAAGSCTPVVPASLPPAGTSGQPAQ